MASFKIFLLPIQTIIVLKPIFYLRIIIALGLIGAWALIKIIWTTTDGE
jgi:hypothetical protein